MISLVIHPLSAQALPTTKSVDFSTDLNKVYQDFGNPENGILIAAGKSNKRPKPNSYPTHRTRESLHRLIRASRLTSSVILLH